MLKKFIMINVFSYFDILVWFEHFYKKKAFSLIKKDELHA